MTKLNITNKTIYKLKKNKNQSKKNVPKKRKYKKRKQRNGRSFRKRRRKYNIKNNSIKKYKKQKGGVGEIDTKTASIKNKEKEVKQLENQQKEKEQEIKTQEDKLQELGISHIDENSASFKIQQKILKLGLKKEDENKKKKNLDDYKEYVEKKLKGQKESVKALKKKIKDNRTSIKNSNTKIKNDNAKIGKLNTQKKAAGKRKGDLQERIDNAPEAQMTGSLELKIKKEEETKKQLEEKIQKLEADITAQTTMIPQGMKQVNENMTKYFENQKGFMDRPQTEEVEIKEGDYQANVDTPVKDDDKLQTKINKYYKDNIEKKTNESDEEYYKRHIDTDLDTIVNLLTEEQKWISETQNKIENRLKKVEKELDTTNKELIEQNKKDVKEEEEEQDKISKEKEEKEKIKENIENKKEEMRQDEKEWQKTQHEASKTIEQGENVFQDKIKNIAAEDDMTIEGVKKAIEGAKKTLKELEKQKPGRKATEKDKEDYNKSKKKMEKDLVELNKKYDSMTKGEVAKLKKPGVMSYRSTKDKYKKQVEKIEKKALEDKEKSIESRGARRNWAKAGLAASKVLHTQFKAPTLAPYISNDMVEKDKLLTKEEQDKLMIEKEHLHIIYNTPYISNEQDDVYAHGTKPSKPDFGKPFYNYYLMKTIKAPDDKEMYIFEMIEQRKARYIKWLMRKENGEVDIKELTEQFKMFEKSSGLMRNTLDEKIIALTFLEFLISRTDEIYIPPLPQPPTEEQKKESDASKSKRTIIDLHKTTIDGHSLFKLFCIYVPGYVNDASKKVSQDVINSVNQTSMTKETAMGEPKIIDHGLNKWNDNKNIYQECGLLVQTDYDDNYVNIGVSKINNTDSKWEKKTEEEKETKMNEQVAEHKNALKEKNKAKNIKDKSLNRFIETIENKIKELKIDETNTKIKELEVQRKETLKKVKELKLELAEKKDDRIQKMRQQYEEEKRKTDEKLKVKEGLLKAQKENIQKQEQEMENIKANLEAQRDGLKNCKEEEADTKEQYNTKIIELEDKLREMEQDKKDMIEKMNELEEGKKNAEAESSEFQSKIKETEDRKEALEKDIKEMKSPTEVTEKTVIGDAESDEGDPLEDALDAATTEDGAIDIPLKENEPMMFYLTLGQDGNINVATSKTPGENISSWLMGSNKQEGADK